MKALAPLPNRRYMMKTTSLPRWVAATAAAVLSTSSLSGAAAGADTLTPPDPDPADTDAVAPKLVLPRRVVRVPSTGARAVRVPLRLSESAKVDLRVAAPTGRSRTVDARRAGMTTLKLPLWRTAPLVRAFDRRGKARLTVKLTATDAAGNRSRRAVKITVLPPRGYVPSDKLTNPLPGYAASSGFGHRWGRMHQGIDFGAPSGTPIRAAAPGRVLSTGWESGYGRVTKLQHARGFQTLYAHQSRIVVRPGQRVHRGQVIGRVGNTGRSFGSHLHFEVHRAGRAHNPARYLRRGA